MPDGVIYIRSKIACFYHDEKISMLRPEQRECWFEPLKHQAHSTEIRSVAHKGKVALTHLATKACMWCTANPQYRPKKCCVQVNPRYP